MNENAKGFAILFATVWILITLITWIIGLAVSVVYLSPVLFLGLKFFGVSQKIVFFGVVGYTAVNTARMLKVSPEERELIRKILTKHKRILLITTIAIYVDFALMLILSSNLYQMFSAAILVPLLWYLIEDWVISKGYWFLTPSSLVAGALLKIMKIKQESKDVVSKYYLPGFIPLTGKVQWKVL